MTPEAILIIAIVLLIVGFTFYKIYTAFRDAPMGWEDQDGFHFGTKNNIGEK